MSKVSVTKEKLDTLAEAVGAKSGQSIPLTIDQMTSAVLSIQDVYNQDKTLTPRESSISVTADNGYSGLGTVTIEPISSYYIGSAVPQNDSSNVTVNNSGYINVGSGYYPYDVIKSLSTQGGKTIYPRTRLTQTAVAANKYTTGTITVNPMKLDAATVTPANSAQIIRPTAINVLVDNWYAYDISGSQFYKNDVNLSSLTNGTRILIYGALGVTNNGGTTTETQVRETFVWQGSNETINVGTAGSSASLYFDKTNNSIRLNTNGYYDAYRFTILNSQYDGLSQVVVNSVPTENRTFTSNGTYTPTSGKWINSVTVNVPTGSTINNQNKTVTPTESQQSVTYDSGYTGLETVTIDAISSTYIGSGITQRSSTDLTASGATVTVPAGYYSTQVTKSVSNMVLPTSTSGTGSGTSKATISRSTSDQYINIPTGYNETASYYEISAVANGTAGTPTATKGTVSNHSISVTPSVTNTTGYITGGTKTGTAVTVNASELVSGNKAIISNDTDIDVTNYATVSVAVPSDIHNQNKTITPTTNQQSVTADNGYSGLGTVTVNAIPNAVANPTLELNNYSSSGNNYVLQGVTDPSTPFYSTDGQAQIVLPKAIMGIATTAQVLEDATFTSMNGVAVSGAMPNNGALSGTITTQGGTYTIPAGYTSGGTVTASLSAGSLTNSIINGASFEETTGDYGFRTTVNIPAGYYNATQLTKEFSAILPAPDTEGTAAQVLIGYDLYNHEGEVISGTMTNNGTWNRTLDQTTTSVTIPAGYHSGSGTVSHTTVNIPDPTITVSNSGLITASGSWTRGFTTDNSYSNTQQLTTQAAKTVTPTESEQTAVASGVYTTGVVKVGAISSTYVGSGITSRSSSDLTVSGATVTAPAGYYSTAASKSVATMTLPTSASSSATSGATNKATIGRSTSAQYINIPVGYNSTASYYTISAVANGSATNSGTASGSSATISTGTNTITLSKAVSITPTVSAGYVSSGTAGNVTVSLTASVTTKTAATITPTTSNQTIASGTYLTGTQTIAGDSDLTAGNIKSGVQIFGVTGSYSGLDTSDATAGPTEIIDGVTAYVNGQKITGTLVVQTYYTGSTAPSSSLGNNGDIYLQS